MPRRLRVEYPGAIYHLMDRGDRREEIGTFKGARSVLHCGSQAQGKTASSIKPCAQLEFLSTVWRIVEESSNLGLIESRIIE